jgi:hypothetical protein
MINSSRLPGAMPAVPHPLSSPVLVGTAKAGGVPKIVDRLKVRARGHRPFASGFSGPLVLRVCKLRAPEPACSQNLICIDNRLEHCATFPG